MTLSLRERRKQQTARDIQLATLNLAVERGLENITTEEIAISAGVSTRTFFNYFANKESAAVGTPPAFTEDDRKALSKGEGPIQDDLKRFLDQHVERLAADEAIIRMVGTMLRTNERARGILEGIIIRQRDSLAEHLVHRVHDRQVANALASSVMDTIARTIRLWEQEDHLTLNAALDAVWDGLTKASTLLSASPKTD